jgi:hypothetical protein
MSLYNTLPLPYHYTAHTPEKHIHITTSNNNTQHGATGCI